MGGGRWWRRMVSAVVPTVALGVVVVSVLVGCTADGGPPCPKATRSIDQDRRSARVAVEHAARAVGIPGPTGHRVVSIQQTEGIEGEAGRMWELHRYRRAWTPSGFVRIDAARRSLERDGFSVTKDEGDQYRLERGAQRAWIGHGYSPQTNRGPVQAWVEVETGCRLPSGA